MADVQPADPDGECGIASALMRLGRAPSTTTRDDILVPGGCICRLGDPRCMTQPV